MFTTYAQVQDSGGSLGRLPVNVTRSAQEIKETGRSGADSHLRSETPRRTILPTPGTGSTDRPRSAAALPVTHTGNDDRSTRTPGPIVVDRVTRLKYWPFAAAGLARCRAFINDWKFSLSASTSKEALPIGQ